MNIDKLWLLLTTAYGSVGLGKRQPLIKILLSTIYTECVAIILEMFVCSTIDGFEVLTMREVDHFLVSEANNAPSSFITVTKYRLMFCEIAHGLDVIKYYGICSKNHEVYSRSVHEYHDFNAPEWYSPWGYMKKMTWMPSSYICCNDICELLDRFLEIMYLSLVHAVNSSTNSISNLSVENLRLKKNSLNITD